MNFRLILCFLLFSHFNYSQPAGSPDTTFGTNGLVGHTLTIDGLLHGISVYDFHLLPGEKILAVGIAKNGCSNSSNYFGIIFRLNNDGTLDTAFNSTGYRLFANYYFQSIIPADNNTFYVIENNHLLKINGNGEPDINFGNNGFLSTDIQAFKGLFTQDGKIVLGGRKMNASAQWELAATRINTHGTVDSGFANNGTFTIPHVSGSGTSFGGMHIDSQNRLLLVGRRQVSQNNGKIIAFRLLNDGTYDTGFANAGEYFENVHHNARAQGIKTTANGNIVIAGNGQYGPFDSHGLILLQLDSNGTLDSGFASAGRLHLPIYSESTAHNLHILNDNSIVVTGGYESTYIAKFDAQGTPANDFGTNGVVNEFHFAWTGFNTTSYVTSNRIALAANTAFAHCAQQKYEALFMRHFLDDQGINLIAYPASDLITCDTSTTGFETFDLTVNDTSIISGQIGATVSYHETLADAQTGTAAIPNPQTYTNTTNPQTVYARIQDGMGNFDTTGFDLIVSPNPIPGLVDDMALCDAGNGTAEFDLSIAGAQAVDGQPNLTPTYYNTIADAVAGGATGQIFSPFTSGSQIIYLRLTDDISGCFTIVPFGIEIVSNPQITLPAPLTVCDEGVANGLATFNLSVATTQITGNDPNLSVTYHFDQTDADNGVNQLPLIYQNQTPYFQTIYVRVVNQTTGCYGTAPLDLIVEAAPAAFEPAPLTYCDLDNDGFGVFTLTDAENQITGGASGIDVTYHLTQADADNGANAIDTTVPFYNSVPYIQILYARVDDNNVGCYVTVTLQLHVTPLPSPVEPTPLEECDPDNIGFTEFDLDSKIPEILNGEPDLIITFHETFVDALDGTFALTSPYLNMVQYQQTIYVRVENTITGCYTTVELLLIVNDTPQVPTVLDDLVLCTEDPAGTGFLFDLTIQESPIYGTQDPSLFNLTYHLTEAEAQAGTNAIADPSTFANTSNPQTIYIRLEDPATGCFATASFDLIVVQLFMAQSPDNIYINEGDGDGIAVFDLTVNEPLMLGTQSSADITFYYFETLTDAVNNINTIQNPNQFVNTSNPQTIYVRMENNLSTYCSLIDLFEIETDEFLNIQAPEANQITFYPNPVKNVLYLNSLYLIKQIEIFTLNGQLIKLSKLNLESNEKRIDFSELATGTYLLKITTEKGTDFKQVVKK